MTAAAKLPRSPVWLLALLLLTAALLWLSADSIQARASQTVPSDWEHIPDRIEPGDSFRLLFVTSTIMSPIMLAGVLCFSTDRS
ncbi:MAG: hypothetical protein OXD31_08410 [Chloroflexi bacterium]|nr:hypothetical protein [Chloroflexota bacterium]